jgi:uncharacterized membrane protein YphA (DoxX/SURF4 family)
MSELQPRRGSGPSRRARADRAYTLVKVTGGLLAATIALIVLAVLGVVGGGLAVIAGLLTAVSAVVLRRTVR